MKNRDDFFSENLIPPFVLSQCRNTRSAAAQLIQEKIWCISSCKLPRLIDIRSSLKPCSLGRHWLALQRQRDWIKWRAELSEIHRKKLGRHEEALVNLFSRRFFCSRQNYSSLKRLWEQQNIKCDTDILNCIIWDDKKGEACFDKKEA